MKKSWRIEKSGYQKNNSDPNTKDTGVFPSRRRLRLKSEVLNEACGARLEVVDHYPVYLCHFLIIKSKAEAVLSFLVTIRYHLFIPVYPEFGLPPFNLSRICLLFSRDSLIIKINNLLVVEPQQPIMPTSEIEYRLQALLIG